MKTVDAGRLHRRRRSRAGCDGSGPRLGRPSRGGRRIGEETSLTTKTTVRAVIAAGTYVAQDMRDRDGLTRPMLRRAALRMAVSRQPALRRLGSAYLRADPPATEELPAPPALPYSEVTPLPPPGYEHDQVIDLDPSEVEDADAGAAV